MTQAVVDIRNLIALIPELTRRYKDQQSAAKKCFELAHTLKAVASSELEEATRQFVAIEAAVGVTMYGSRTHKLPRFIPAVEIPEF